MVITHLILLADEMTDLASPLVLPSSEQEWQIQIYSYWQMK